MATAKADKAKGVQSASSIHSQSQKSRQGAKTSIPVKGSKQAFRFLDLPKDVRVMIYCDYLAIKEKHPIRIAAYQSLVRKRRPVRGTFLNPEIHRGLDFDRYNGKWIGQPITEEVGDKAILRVCKEILEETAPILYSNEFEFGFIEDLRFFLETIGHNQGLLKSISLWNWTSYWISGASVGSAIFKAWKDTRSLRSLKINFHSLRRTYGNETRITPTLRRFIRDIEPFMRSIHAARNVNRTSTSVLEILNVTCEPCSGCQNGNPCLEATGNYRLRCTQGSQLCAKVQARMRSYLADELGIDG